MTFSGSPDPENAPVGVRGWRAAPAGQFVWAHWGDGHALFHRPSGKTHFLNEAGASLLRELLAAPGDPFEADPSLHDLLLRFEALGLVERVPER